jgi:shikimate dehydrogenase
MPRLAVLGQPIAHSRSPAMHSAALGALGLADEWSYEAIEVSPGEFAERVRRMAREGFAGANVTIPHKLAALETSDKASERARAIGAANTLSFRDGSIDAENTDAEGFLAALGQSPGGTRALVLGAGGSARAVVWALTRGGAAVSVWNRTESRAERLAADFGVAAVQPEGGRLRLDGFDLLVNTTSVGLAAAGGDASDAEPGLEALPLDPRELQPGHLVADLVYGMNETPLIAAARAGGATTVDGLEVLLHQGAASLRIWTGLDPPLETMRTAARGS